MLYPAELQALLLPRTVTLAQRFALCPPALDDRGFGLPRLMRFRPGSRFPQLEQMNCRAHFFQDRLIGRGLSDPVADSLLADGIQELPGRGPAKDNDRNHWMVSLEMSDDCRSIHAGHFQVTEKGGDARSLVVLFHQRDRGLSALGEQRTVSGSLQH